MRGPPPGLLTPFTIQDSAPLSQDIQITVALRDELRTRYARMLLATQSIASLSMAKMQLGAPSARHSISSMWNECPPVTHVSASSKIPCAR
jgi:hypothetical protein